ncbi:carbohydrate ABC transporter permease [Lactococcus nasutitermitis]|uniref:Carbohydrate ABC transporter permease n=1 Tax=Lactococcus nasutitermitis TaxID=1652957 RepID=A0ABV9JFG6_9LACT|nr:sugar ABC transporter permease [Lactococcus nasutitermitis]
MEQTKSTKKKRSRRQTSEMLQGYGFLIPAGVIAAIFFIYAVVFAVYMSFNKVNMLTNNYSWNNFQNYINIFSDPTVKIALENTLGFVAIVVPCQTIISLVIAYVLSSRGVKGKSIFRLIYFLPTLTSSAALTLIFMFLFNVNGPINQLFIGMGLYHTPINFLNEPFWSMKVIVAMNIWSTVPFYMTIYLASLVDLPYSLYEAAMIDGASAWQRLRYITVPYLRPITTYVLLTGIIGTFQMFDQAYIFSGGTGGPSNSTLTLALLIYQYATTGLGSGIGYAAAIAVLLGILIFVVSRIAEKLNGGLAK